MDSSFQNEVQEVGAYRMRQEANGLVLDETTIGKEEAESLGKRLLEQGKLTKAEKVKLARYYVYNIVPYPLAISRLLHNVDYEIWKKK